MSAQLGGDVEELTFSELNRMGGVPTREIARNIASNQNLTWVAVDEPLNIPDSQLIYEAIHGHENIRKLVFRMDTADLMAVVLFLPQMKNLLQLGFYRTAPRTAPFRLQLNRNLQEVCLLEANGIGDTVAEAVARVLRFRSCLTLIAFCDCHLSNDGIVSIGQSLQCHSMVTKVHVFERNLIVEDVPAVKFARGIETNTMVDELFFGAHRVAGAGWERIIRALTVSETLAEVQLFLGRLYREGWFAVARLLAESTIQRKFYLSVGRNVDMHPITTYHALRTFCLTGMGMDDIRNVCDALAAYDVVDNLVLRDGRLTAEGILLIRRMLANNTTLGSLVLHRIRMNDDNANAFFEFLKQSESLDSLELPSRRVGARDIVASSQMIKKLSLSDNNLGDAGFGALGRALEHNLSLEELKVKQLRHNITEHGVRALLDGIRAHQGLKDVEITPLLSTSQQDELAFYLERNNHVETILHANVPLSIWPLVLKRANDCRFVDDRLRAPDMLYYFVKEKCDLFTRGPSSRKRKRNNA